MRDPGRIQGYPIHPAREATLWGTLDQGYPIPGRSHGGLEVMCQGYPIASPPFTPPVGRFRCYHLDGAGGVVELRLLLLHLIPPAIPCDISIPIPSANAAIIEQLIFPTAIAQIIFQIEIIRGLPHLPAIVPRLSCITRLVHVMTSSLRQVS